MAEAAIRSPDFTESILGMFKSFKMNKINPF
jgi:hypothetical protein